MPYIYSASYEAYASGVPVMRPLVLEYPADRRVYETDDEYFFGEALLVAPITRQGVDGRQVFLPPGDWIDYWTGQRYAGNRSLEYRAAPEVMPLFVKAGAIIPMQPEMAYIGERPVDPLILDIYPASRSSTVLYEDDGNSLDYQRGAFAKTQVSCEASAPSASISLRVAAPTGDYKVTPRSYEFRVHIERAPVAVRVSGALAAPGIGSGSGATWSYDPAAKVLTVRTDPAKKGLEATVTINR